MNKLAFPLFLSLIVPCFAQSSLVKITPAGPPDRKFSNLIPDGTSWAVSVKDPSDSTDSESQSTPETVMRARYAHLQIKHIENSYSSGVRREVIQYRDGSKITRYLLQGLVAIESPQSGQPVIEEQNFSSTGPTWGTNRMAELGWVADKYFIGTASFGGRECYVYRQYQIPQITSDPDDPVVKAVPINEARNFKSASIVGTVYVDKNTMLPVAYEKEAETWLYDMNKTFSPFNLPAAIAGALQARAAEEEKFKQRYSVPQ